MSLPSFLAPASHLLFANRNLDIVVLCFVLFGVAIYALTNRWRADRLERELANSRSSASTMPAGRRYAAGPTMQESAPEPGGLPPIKGGRSYARNLGSALQKAGVSGPQIYSPPTPPGFAPNTTVMPGAPQPGMGQPSMGQPYAPATGPWPAPPAAPSPWAFPGAPGRNVPTSAPAPAPFYGQQPHAAPSPPSPFVPAPAPATSGSGPFQPPSPSIAQPAPPAGPFAPPFGAPASGPVPTPPAFAPPGAGPLTTPAVGPMPAGPGYPVPPAMPAAEPEPADASRRGKPKRRRFNFNVLENLEKIVQSKPAEPAVPAPTSWTPPPAPAPPAPAIPAVPAAAVPPIPALTPSPETATVTPKPESPTLPFLFGAPKPAAPQAEATPPAAETTPEDAGVAAAEEVAEEMPAVESEAPSPVEDSEQVRPGSTSEPAGEEATDAGQSSRRSMRSMMFGEEITASVERAASEPEPSTVSGETDPSSTAEATPSAADESHGSGTDSDSSWPSYPWERREEASASADSEEPAAQAVPETSATDDATTDDATTDVESWKATEATGVPSPATEAPWGTSSYDDGGVEVAESAELPTPDTSGVAEATSGTDDGTPAVGTGEPGKPSAGTLVIIEDDQTAASYYSTLFRGNGYEVEVANDGISGVDLCARVQPQVILLDVMMPRQNGILVLQTLRASDETKNTPVVVMSNFSEPTLIKRALQLGALEYVIKTQVEGPALLNALPRWMNREKAFAA